MYKQAIKLTHQTRLSRGFTLVEVLIVVTIIGILAAVALPSYTEYTKRGYRADGKSALLQLSSALERYHTENGSYNGAHEGGKPKANFFPSQAPLDGGDKTYDLTIESTAHSYTLTATPIENSRVHEDGVFTLSSTGVKTYKGEEGWD